MWSHWYAYYIIRSDASYTEQLATHTVVSVLLGTGRLIQTGPHSFVNAANENWLRMDLHTSTDGTYSLSQEPLQTVSLIQITCSKACAQEEYVPSLKAIATNLRWELILEEDDEGNEDIVLQSRY